MRITALLATLLLASFAWNSASDARAIDVIAPVGAPEVARATHLDLRLTDGAVTFIGGGAILPRHVLDQIKSRAALEGLVTMASIGTGGEQSAPGQTRRARAEASIAALNAQFYMSLMILTAGGLMWMCVGLQREQV